MAILWFPYKRDWILRQGLIKKPVPTPVPMWEHLVILGVAASIAGNIIISLTPLTQWFPAVEGAVAEIDAADWLQQVIGVCLIIPAAEEMVFRGIGYGGLRDEMGPAWAALFSALFFGAFHGNLVQGIYAGLLGIDFSFYYGEVSQYDGGVADPRGNKCRFSLRIRRGTDETNWKQPGGPGSGRLDFPGCNSL